MFEYLYVCSCALFCAVTMNINFLSVVSSRMIEVQVQMAQRAIELLALPEDTPSFILDVG